MRKIKSLFFIIISVLCIISISITGYCESIAIAETTTQGTQEEHTTQSKTENTGKVEETVKIERIPEPVKVEMSRDSVYLYENFTIEVKVEADVAEWDLNIVCDDDIKVVSGKTEFKGTSLTKTKSVNLVLLAKKNGFRKINIIGSVFYKDNVGEGETKTTEKNIDKQIAVNAMVKPDSLIQDLGEGNERANCRLKSITTSVGAISPFFDSNKTSYILIVPDNASKVKISAEAESDKTVIEGTGEYDLTKTDEILLCSTSESGNVRTYILKVLKGYDVLFQQDMNGECISLVDIGQKTPPSGFSVSNMSKYNKMISVWMLPFFNYRIVRGITSDGVEEYYSYDTSTDSVTSPFLNIKANGSDYIYVGIGKEKPNAENLVLVKKNICGKLIECYQYNDIELLDVVIFPLYNTEEKELNYYEYNIKLNKLSLSQEFRQEAEATSDETPTASVAVITSIMAVDSHTVKSLKEALETRDTIILIMLGVLVLAAIAFFTSIIVHLSYRQQKLDELFGEDEEFEDFLQFDKK